jgi:hypothetical protein
VNRKWKWIIASLVMAATVLLAFKGLVELRRSHVRSGVAVRLSLGVRSIGVAPFVAKIKPDSIRSDAHDVEFTELDGLSAELKEHLLYCKLIGDSRAPMGIEFYVKKGGAYYLSLDGAGVPGYFAGYRSQHIIYDVYRIYRTHD